MGYGRDDSRGGREPRSRFDEDDRGGGRYGRGEQRGADNGDRGFFERAGDEIASWFGDEDAERRRERDDRGYGRDGGRDMHREGGRFSGGQSDSYGRGVDRDYGGYQRSGGESGGFGRQSFMGAENYDRMERGPRYRDEGYRRPYTGRSASREPMGGRDDMTSRDSSRGGYRPMTGDYGRSSEEERSSGMSFGAMGKGSTHDRHYGEWRQRQIEDLDRDYDEYRREHQSKFESDFSNWRGTRQTKRQMLGQVREHMDVVGSDDQPVGKVDKVRGDRIVLTKDDSPDGQHHALGCSMIDRVEGDKVILSSTADEARSKLSSESRNRALFERDDDRETGPHMLNRSFSGTY